MKTLIKASIYISIIAVIGFALNYIFSQNRQQVITYITEAEINGIHFYKFDVWRYMENIRTTFTDTPQLELHLQERQWINNLSGWEDFGNNMAFMVNVIITGINALLYPMRLVFYVIQTILAIIGLPMKAGTYDYNPLKWLIDLAKLFTKFEFPYI